MKTKSNIKKLREAIRLMVLGEVKSLKNEDISALPKVTIPANVNTKLQMALTQIRDAKLTFNQKIQLVGMVIDSLGIDKSELSKIDTKLKSVMGSDTAYTAGANDYKAKYEGKATMKPELRERLKEIAKEVMSEDAEYQQFFKNALEKAGKSIPEMSEEEKKAFFDKIDAAWDGKGEKREVSEDVATELPSTSIPSDTMKERLAIKESKEIPIEKVKIGQEIIFKHDVNATPFVVKTIDKANTGGKSYIILKGSKGNEVLKREVGKPVVLISEITKLKKTIIKEGADWILLPSINKMVDSYEGHFYDAKNPMTGDEAPYGTSEWRQLYKKLKGNDKKTVDSIIKSEKLGEAVKKKIKEAWDTDTPIKKTGENAGKSISQLESELTALKARSKTYQDKGEPVPADIKTKEHQLNFAIRAKRNWKGGTSNEAITEMGDGDVFYKRIMKLYDTGGEFTKKKVASAVSHDPNANREKIIKDLRGMNHDDITKSADKLRIEGIIKEGDGSLAKVGDLIDLPAKPSYQAKAGTYKLTSIDKNPNGHYMYEFIKNGRTVIFGEYELKAVLHKESKQNKKKLVKEAVSPSDLGKIKQIVQSHVDDGGKLVGLGQILKKAGYKADFTTSPIPMITIKLGSTIFALCWKNYVDDPDFVIGDIAGGTL